jgi:3-oxoacyl-[acyl-carrier protein] reductase
MSEHTARSALITGAGQNIGRSCAIRLAQDGFNVVINGRSNRDACDEVAGIVRAAGGKAVIAMGDVGSAEGAQTVADAALSAFGGIDVLVHNAAIRPETPFLEMSEDEWNEVLNVNFGASFWLARAALPGMVEKGWGRVINFAGMNAINGYNGRAHVSASKHAAWGLTKALAKEFGPKGVTVNIISPGPIRPEAGDPAMQEHIRSQESKIPVGRLGEPSEIAATVSLLASEDGGFINGQLLQVNGGTQC